MITINLHQPEFDEYLWPLTDAAWPVDCVRLAEEHRLRHRLQEILAHVQETHVAPRLRRLGTGAHAAAVAEITQEVIAGPLNGAYWERRLREPVPRSLRAEWSELGTALREVCQMEGAGRRRVRHR